MSDATRIPQTPVESIAELYRRLRDLELRGGGAAGALPAGGMAPFAGAAAPSGWAFCTGQAVSRTTYPKLFAALGIAHGAGDGTTTFNLPDMRGRFPIGVGTLGSDTYALGAKAGEARHVLTEAELAAHDHTITHTHTIPNHAHTIAHTHPGDTLLFPEGQTTGSTGHVHSGADVDSYARSINQTSTVNNTGSISGNTGASSAANSGNPTSLPATSASSAANTGSAGSATAHENRPPYLATNWIIRLE